MEVASLCLCVVLLCFSYVCYLLLGVWRTKLKVLKLGLPHFEGVPLLGNSLDLIKAFGAAPGVPFSVYTLEVVTGYRKALQEHDIFWVGIGPYCYFVLSTPQVVEVLLGDNRQLNKSDDYIYLHPWLGTGLITSSYMKWKKHRRLLTPAFHFRILDEFQPVISDYSDLMIHKIKSQVGKPYTNLEPFITNCALDIIAGTALGVNIEAQKDNSSPYVAALHTVGSSLFTRMMTPWLWPDAVFWLSPEGKKVSRSLKVISSFIKKVIHDKRRDLELNKDDVHKYFEDNPDSKKIRRAFLEIMLMHNMINKNDQFSDQDIEDEVNTFTFAGHDTTTTGMIWTLYLLGLYPEVQAKVFEELEEIFGQDLKRPITLEDVKQMEYLTRVIKESQRLYPSVPYIGRKLDKDFTINGVTLPKGVIVIVSPPVLHREPESFPNPEVFDPDRFLETNKHPFSYVPFSAGPRNCIGQRFAMLEMKTVIANVIRNYKVTSLDHRDKVLVCSELISRPHKPIRTKLEIRA